MGDAFADAAASGPMLLAIGAAALAGLVSFLSPCVLPLMPGYLSYVTGLAGADLDAALGVAAKPPTDAAGVSQPGGAGVSQPGAARVSPSGGAGVSQAGAVAVERGGVAVAAPDRPARLTGRGRVLIGTVLFVLGFAAVFTLLATLVANIGLTMLAHKRTLDIVLGVLVIVLGLAFLGLVPGLQREVRIHRLPAAGLIGAPVLGALFGLSWMPCTGPTLGAVLGLATRSGQTDRAVVLALAYSLGLGLPFVLFGLFFRRLLGVFAAVRRHSQWVTRIGGALLIVVGLVLVTGGWNDFLIWLQTTFNFDAGTLL
ncbi:cytochrome c-type biogenesis protein [Krasilnikovia cinnamomea]|uniref:Cytochrome c-type biogenesis protein n=1 Tax=Krasilnikovia cinnamomea TaxID=349313 RepID=A0A4Q7ZKK2_9ACTN|nr:cytochrome c biogenesis protein CcdA [Krasilnikovia cinnamomea]RZU51460.1 cytochrome c-type biogenesis protein [Krasilnikovia cinnamomea]